MLITRPTIKASEIRIPRGTRPADRLLYTDALDEDAKVPAMPLVESIEYPSKGKDKGRVLVKVKGRATPFALDRHDDVIVERQVADEAERVTYLAAMDTYLLVDEAVRMRQKMEDAASSLIARAEEARDAVHPYAPFGGSVLRSEAGDFESYVAQYAMFMRLKAEALDAAGISPEQVQEWSKDRRYTARNHNVLRPEQPVNGDCGRDGLPVPCDGGTYTCAPLDRESVSV